MKAAIFDLDGTLIDSAPGLWHAANQLLPERGLPPLPLARVAGFIGHGVGRFVQGILQDAGEAPDAAALEAAVSRFVTLYDRDPMRDCRLYDGVAEVLAALERAGWSLGLCTNKPEATAREMLAATGLSPLFSVVTGGDTLPQRKPDPAPLLQTLRQIGAGAEATVYVGDSTVDAETAERAGLPFAFHSAGYHNGAPIRAALRFARYDASLPAALAGLIG